MNKREFANRSKKITINDAAAQKKGEAASSIELVCKNLHQNN